MSLFFQLKAPQGIDFFSVEKASGEKKKSGYLGGSSLSKSLVQQ